MSKSDELPTGGLAERRDLAVALYIAACVALLVVVGLTVYLWTLKRGLRRRQHGCAIGHHPAVHQLEHTIGNVD